MKYMGSKRRIAKHLLPIMVGVAQSRGIAKWVEPFVGGGNMIDKVPPSFERIGYDLNEHAIMAMIDIRDRAADLPDSVTEQEYNDMKGLPAASVTSWVRFECSFGAKFEGGYARNKAGANYAVYGRNLALKQQPLLQGVQFTHGCYQDLDVANALIYCDPPYANTVGYKTGDFNHGEFFDWCRAQAAKGNVVFVSEYNAPADFICLWQGEIKTNFASSRTAATHNAVERLFMVSV